VLRDGAVGFLANLRLERSEPPSIGLPGGLDSAFGIQSLVAPRFKTVTLTFGRLPALEQLLQGGAAVVDDGSPPPSDPIVPSTR